VRREEQFKRKFKKNKGVDMKRNGEKNKMEITTKAVNNKKSNKEGKVERVGATNGRLKEMQEGNNGVRIERQVGRSNVKK
jgi:hypothetical protein